ncbi:MAG: VPLPA-CTERM sorting domain-containing protein [Pseudomonadota bacterium]
MNLWSSTVAAGAVALASQAAATTISITEFSAANLGSATSDLSNVVTEDFEMLGGEREIAPNTSLASTTVGSFTTLGGTGTGGSRIGTGTNVAIRDGNVYGRTNTSGGIGDQYFLDSNDTHGIRWNASSSLGLFNTLVFSLMDGSEFSYLRVIADGVTEEQRVGGRLANGNTSLVEISLDRNVSSLVVELSNFTSFGGNVSARNDGFSIDSVSVGIAPVPLPAGLPLLAAGIGAFAVLRRKQRKS